MADEVRLVDLEVIKRYSLAVRQESAPADDLLVALDASREAVLAAMGMPLADTAAVAKPARSPRTAKANGSKAPRKAAGKKKADKAPATP